MEAARVDNAILLYYLTSEVVHKLLEVGSTHRNIPIHNMCTDDKLHCRMPGGNKNHEDEGDKIDESDAIPNASR